MGAMFDCTVQKKVMISFRLYTRVMASWSSLGLPLSPIVSSLRV